MVGAPASDLQMLASITGRLTPTSPRLDLAGALALFGARGEGYKAAMGGSQVRIRLGGGGSRVRTLGPRPR
jgi:hypothetical protein